MISTPSDTPNCSLTLVNIVRTNKDAIYLQKDMNSLGK